MVLRFVFRLFSLNMILGSGFDSMHKNKKVSILVAYNVLFIFYDWNLPIWLTEFPCSLIPKSFYIWFTMFAFFILQGRKVVIMKSACKEKELQFQFYTITICWGLGNARSVLQICLLLLTCINILDFSLIFPCLHQQSITV